MENFNQENTVEETKELTILEVKEQYEQNHEDYVYLPIGVKYDGQVIRLVQIKEPDGYTEELQSSENYRKHIATVIDATLTDCIIDILDYKLPQNQDKAFKVKEEIVKLLSEPDRQYLMSRIYKYQHGEVVKTTCRCTECSGNTQVDVNLYNDLKIKYLDENLVDHSQDDRMIIKDIELTNPITMNGKKFDKINVRIPNGQTSLSLEKSGNLGQVVTKMILQMISCNLDKFIPNENEIKRWSTKVRRSLLEDVGERRVGFINSVKYTCEHCSKEVDSPIQVTSFLEN